MVVFVYVLEEECVNHTVVNILVKSLSPPSEDIHVQLTTVVTHSCNGVQFEILQLRLTAVLPYTLKPTTASHRCRCVKAQSTDDGLVYIVV